jgi:hypothetical protein
LKTLKTSEVHKGRSYSDWIEEWSNLLVSASPDNQGVEMLFLRGDLDYDPQSQNSYRSQGKYFDKTGGIGETIYSNTAVFIPIMTAMYSINDVYEAAQLLDDQSLRYAVRKDTTESGKMWLRYQFSKSRPISASLKWNPVLDRKDQIMNYYCETPMFSLNVSSTGPLIDKFEYPLIPGSYETVQGGYFVIVYDLMPGFYRFHFGGFGKRFYYTDSVYDIEVQDQVYRDLGKDVSDIMASGPGSLPRHLHLKTEADVDSKSPFP